MPKIYGSSEIWGDLLVTGSFSILGSASSINTTSLVVSDTIIALGHSQSGTPALDEGIMFVRGTGLTQAFIWDESDDTFALIGTNDDHTIVGDININSYSNLRIGGLTTSTLRVSNGATDGYFLKSNVSGDGSWSQITSSDVTGIPGGLTGSGTTNYVPYWTNSHTLSSTSSIYINGETVNIGSTNFSDYTYSLYIESNKSAGLVTKKTSQDSTNFGHTIDIQSQTNLSTNIAEYKTVSATGSNYNYGDYVSITGKAKRSIAGYYEVTGASISNTGIAIDVSGDSEGITGLYISAYSGPQYSSPTFSGSAKAIETYIGDVTFNSSSSDSDFKINGYSSANLFFVDASEKKIGIGGTTSPSEKLTVIGTVSTTGFKMVTGASNGYVLTTDGSGNASWQPTATSVNIYSSTQAFTKGTTYSINHALNTNNILINIWNDSTGDLLTLSTKRTGTNTVDLYSTEDFSSVRIVIMGG